MLLTDVVCSRILANFSIADETSHFSVQLQVERALCDIFFFDLAKVMSMVHAFGQNVGPHCSKHGLNKNKY